MSLYQNQKKERQNGFFTKAVQAVQKFVLGRNAKPSKSINSELQRLTESVVRKEIPDVLSARRSALDVWYPRRDRLQELYKNVVDNNLHLKAVMRKRALFLTNHPFKIVNQNGDELPAKTKLLQHAWFRRFLEKYTEALSYGYSVLQFLPTQKNSVFKLENIDRRHIRPETGEIVINTFDMHGIKYEQFNEAGIYILPICNDTEELGFLNLVSIMDILSRHSWAAWDEGEQLMTTFIRVVETAGFKDPETRKLLSNFLDEMGSAAYAVLPSESKLHLHETSRQDFHNVPERKITLCNELISKLYLGQTMTTDNGGSYSQSKVHLSEQEDIIEDDKENSKDFINDFLLPFLREHFNFPIAENEYFVWDDERNLYPEEKIKIDTPLLQAGYVFSKEYIEQTYGVEIEQMPNSQVALPTPVATPSVENVRNWVKPKVSILSKVNSLYLESHQCTSHKSNDEFNAPDTEDIINELIELIYRDGTFDIEGEEVQSLLDTYANSLLKAVESGFGEFDTNDEEFYKSLTNNVQVFSAAKTRSELVEMTNLLLDQNGKLKRFSTFKQDALKLHDTYNRAWLKTEYNHAVGSSQMARKWRDIDNDSLPYLQYDTVGDNRVRKSHKKLEGVIRKVDDDFWNRFYPPNDWGCRCDVRSLAEAEETTLSTVELPDLKSQFNSNVGKTGIIFPSNHPYFEQL